MTCLILTGQTHSTWRIHHIPMRWTTTCRNIAALSMFSRPIPIGEGGTCHTTTCRNTTILSMSTSSKRRTRHIPMGGGGLAIWLLVGLVGILLPSPCLTGPCKLQNVIIIIIIICKIHASYCHWSNNLLYILNNTYLVNHEFVLPQHHEQEVPCNKEYPQNQKQFTIDCHNRQM